MKIADSVLLIKLTVNLAETLQTRTEGGVPGHLEPM